MPKDWPSRPRHTKIVIVKGNTASNVIGSTNWLKSLNHFCSRIARCHGCFFSSFHDWAYAIARRPSSVSLSVCKLFCANRFFNHKHDWIATKLAHDGPHMDLYPGCAQGQGQGQRSRDSATSVMSRNVSYTVYGLTFCLYMRSLYETPLYSPSSISVRQLDV